LQYSWSGTHAFETAAIPKAAGDKLRMASAAQIKVLLWLACAGQGRFDANACAATCGVSPAVCEECLQYWVQEGLVTVSGSAAVRTAVAPAPSVEVKSEPTPPVAMPAPLLAGDPSAAQRATRDEALRVKAEDPSFSMLLDTAASKLGKILSPSDLTMFLYLYRELALPPEVILMVIGYAVQNGKGKIAYIEKTALGWHEEGIRTFEAAEAHIRRLEQCKDAWERMSDRYDLSTVRPTFAQKDTVRRWIFEWELPHEVIDEIVACTKEKTGKLQFAYADRLAERLYAGGVTTAQAAREELSSAKSTEKPKTSRARMKTATDRAPSYDMAEYEKLVKRHRPTPPKED